MCTGLGAACTRSNFHLGRVLGDGSLKGKKGEKGDSYLRENTDSCLDRKSAF